MQVGERVREMRRRRKMTVAGLAAASDLTKGFISQLESGKSNPSLASLGRIARSLEVPLSSLMAHEDDTRGLIEMAHGPLVVATHSLYGDNIGLTALTGIQAGTHFLATIPPDYALTSASNRTTFSTAVALLAVLRGSVEISQGNSPATVTNGSLSTWDAHAAYALENRGVGNASLLIFLPSGCARPTLARLRERAPSPAARARYAAVGEGPLRLVAMRAQRQAERRR